MWDDNTTNKARRKTKTKKKHIIFNKCVFGQMYMPLCKIHVSI